MLPKFLNRLKNVVTLNSLAAYIFLEIEILFCAIYHFKNIGENCTQTNTA